VGVWDHPATGDGVRHDALTLLSSLASLGVEAAAIVTLLLWLRRCRQNADLLAPGAARYSLGWVVGAWFTPLLMWWRPRRIILDVHRASGEDSAASSTTMLINVWWTIRVVISVIAITIMAFTGSITVTNPWFTLVDQVANVVGSVALFVIIHRLTAAQVHAVEQGRIIPQVASPASA